VHVNGHARIQVVTAAWHGQALLPLLRHLEQTRGMVALLNTSFNAAGEPIVHTPSEALASAQQMGLDALLLENELYIF
jgi:carbamoyltransferase